MPLAVEVVGLTKSFGRVTALDGLDLSVPTGSVVGFLGPNGAGKSTTIRILLGLLRAGSGRVRVLDGDPWSDAVALHRRLAYVPGDVTLWPNLTGGEVIDLLGRLRGRNDPRRVADLVERFALDPTRRARTYSKGNRQKVALVAALAADVELLVLDEPTSGLDPLMDVVFTRCVRDAAAQGRAVLLSSHLLGEVESLCDTVTIVRAGRTAATGTLAQLRHLARTQVRAEVDGDPAALARLPGVHDLVLPSGHGQPQVTFSVEAAHLDSAVRALSELGLRALACSPPTLEELFLRTYRDDDAASLP